MENLTDIIQFTATGSYSRGASYVFADYLGYKDEIEISPTESIPNPINRITFIENYIKQLLVNLMSDKNIKDALIVAEADYLANKKNIITLVKTDVEQGISISSVILPPEPEI